MGVRDLAEAGEWGMFKDRILRVADSCKNLGFSAGWGGVWRLARFA
jgi:hypothetical protein